ncbi:MacB-like periplasmic core domain protein [Propionibacterium acidifaciens F0233]|uniref:MacB-like periplasmic core domain protein n=1 Tax=Propionibacterium acidifaciens F0233 TaxID=553198 RepID=U2SED6_9ACTN|nr:FtsX-like permease family protein [Propionibacterium acidifaciens]AYW78689.1 FtsX-like permease family protein [Propionibacterium acidifaciens]ERK61047.1 MacB-like periplasmic core domain protein [Propionibacterium acidifaciens F0233]
MRRVAWRSVRSHAGQFILTTLAVVLGAAFLSGTLALRGVLSETFSALTSSTFKADLYVSGSRVEESGSSSNSSSGVLTQPIDGSLAERISALDGVAAARPYSSTTVTLVGADQTPVRSNGAPSMLLPVYPDEYDEQLVSGSRPTGPDQIVLESDALKRSGLRIGDSTHMVVNGEPLEVRVVGEISYGASMAGATIVGMDPSWLMPTIAPDGKVSSISIHLSPGARTQQVCDEIRALLPQGERLQTRAEAIDEQNEAVENILGYVQTFLLVFVVLAMFVGSFIIMNTFAMSVRQRVKEFALLRAIGASVSSVFAVVIFQAVVIGIIGSALGVLAGTGLTRLLMVMLEAGGMPLPGGGIPMTTRIITVSLITGVLVTVAGALLPARDAALTAPVEAMRATSGSRERPLRLRGAVGAVLAAAGAAGVTAVWTTDGLTHRSAVLGAGAGALVIGLLVLSPVLARPVVAVLGLATRIIRPGGRLAVRNLVANTRRTAATSAALLIGMSLVCAGATVAASMRSSIESIVNDSMHADLMVRSASTRQAVQLPAGTAERIKELDGVESTTGYALSVAALSGRNGTSGTGYLATVDPQHYGEFYDPGITSGSLDSLDATHVAAFADTGYALGDQLTVNGPNGAVTATVSAIADPKGISASLYVAPELSAAVGSWQGYVPTDPTQVLASPRGMMINLEPGADKESVRKQIQEIVAPSYVFEVLDADQLSDQTGQQAARMLSVLYALLGLSIVIAILGIVNTLVLSVSERIREIGLMRAVGLGRAQLAGEIICESVLTAVYGTVIGGATGVLLAGALRRVLADEGLTELVIPWSQLGVMLGIAVVVGVIAALWPALRATRLPVLRAIATE